MNILVVDDEKEIADVIELYLKNDQYNVLKFYTGQEALDCIASTKIDLAILDIMLPDVDGFQILKQIREKYTFPVIMLTAKTEYMDKITGLTLGADDYMIKPFDSKELVARVKAVLRRYTAPAAAPTPKSDKYVEYKDLIINLSNYEVIYKGKQVEMTPREIELLFFLASSPNQVFTREQLLDHIWGYEYAGDTRTVDVHIKRIREKISDTDEWSIGTVWSVGYRFEVHNK